MDNAELDVRNARAAEYQSFLRQPHLQRVMEKLVGFLTDGSSRKLTLSITGGEDSYTDGKNIVLGMPSCFFNPDYTNQDWAIILKTLLVHEVQHINHSNFRDIQAIMTWFPKLLEIKGIPSPAAAGVAKDMLNILEDGRIEFIAVFKFPGFLLPFRMLNAEIRHQAGVTKAATTPAEELSDFMGECLSYAKTGRHAPGMEVYKGSKLEKAFMDNKKFIDAAVRSPSSGDCLKYTKKFLKGCADYLSELLQDEEAQQQAGSGNGSNEYTSNTGEAMPSSFGSGKGNPLRSNGSAPSSEPVNDKSSDPAEGQGGEDEDERDEDGGQDTTEGEGKEQGEDPDEKPSDGAGSSAGENEAPATPQKSSKKSKAQEQPGQAQSPSRDEDWTDDFSGCGPEPFNLSPLTATELQALRRGVTDELKAVEEVVPKREESKSLEGLYADEYVRQFSERFPVISNEEAPPEIKTTARRLERSLQRILARKNSSRTNLRRGRLDVNALHRVKMGDDRLFIKPTNPNVADLVVGMAIDNSGSMDSCGARMDGHHYAKYQLARSAACIIESAFQRIAPLKITLFDVSGGVVRHETIKSFDERTKGGKSFASIGELGTGGGNKDGYSIRVLTRELLNRTERQKVLVILSDGLPSDYSGGSMAGLDDVKTAVKEARKAGVIVIPIMFGDAQFRESSKEDFAYMYEKFISCDPIAVASEFEKLFVQLVKHS